MHNKALPCWFLNQGWKHKHIQFSIELTKALVTKKSYNKYGSKKFNEAKRILIPDHWSRYIHHTFLHIFSLYQTIFYSTLFTRNERQTETQVFNISVSNVHLYSINEKKNRNVNGERNDEDKIFHETMKRYQQSMRKYLKNCKL